MNVNMTEEEQVEQLKKWWRQYGNMLMTIVLVVVLTVVGTRWYNDKQTAVITSASSAFNSLMDSVAKNEPVKIESQADYIKSNYSSTIYASSAALLLAKQQVEFKKYQAAEKQLKWVVENSNSNSFKQLAKLRLSRIYLYQRKYDDALTQLNSVDDSLFNSLISEAKGDVYFAEGKNKQANKLYIAALEQLPNQALASKELRMKLNSASIS